MEDLTPIIPMDYSLETSTTTIIGVSNLSIADSREPQTCEVMSYTVPSDNAAPSAALSDAAVRLGNSLLSARVPETAILRDTGEDF